ncbi:hypothetical protein AURDEDRAFT_109967 [Auricularia subglabra TFB-10046 SS5]|nr:hypothetical protein AURDEDRAFT_109967 [Auricularia subglabra TFB-10046 SS5]
MPRTPHSARMQTQDEVDMLQQTEPLLQSSKDAVFPEHQLQAHDYEHRSHAKDKRRQRPPLGLIFGISAAAVLLLLLLLSLWKPGVLHEYVVGEDGELEVVDGDVDAASQDAPDHIEAVVNPAPAKVHGDEHSHGEHSIDYSTYTSFPLTPIQYDSECWKLHQGLHRHGGYWTTGPDGVPDVPHPSASNKRVCTSTITYMLDGYVGLAADLAYMAQIAALARDRNRTFFVMDKWWNRGRWEDYFVDVHKTQPGPEPDCLPPPPEELVACPRTARHWIIGSRTAKFHLSHEFMDEFEDPFKRDLDRQRPMYDAALQSVQETIVPSTRMKTLISTARRSIGGDGGYVGVHIRHGDQLPKAWKYRKGFVPISEFVDGARTVQTAAIWAASDSPAAIADFKEEIGHSVQVTSVSRDLAPDADSPGYVQKEWQHVGEAERRRLTQGMVVDLALLSGLWLPADEAPKAVVCTYGSNVCRLAAVALGWERAFNEKRWVEVDVKGSLAPIWSAFVLFG